MRILFASFAALFISTAQAQQQTQSAPPVAPGSAPKCEGLSAFNDTCTCGWNVDHTCKTYIVKQTFKNGSEAYFTVSLTDSDRRKIKGGLDQHILACAKN